MVSFMEPQNPSPCPTRQLLGKGASGGVTSLSNEGLGRDIREGEMTHQRMYNQRQYTATTRDLLASAVMTGQGGLGAGGGKAAS